MEIAVIAFECQKGSIVPIHKKGDKRVLKNYHPVSLLSICRKITERLLINEMLKFFIENKPLSSNQSRLNKVILALISSYLSLTRHI